MSLEAAMNFVAKMRDDEKIQDQVLNAITGKDEGTAAAAFVTLGKAQGFAFSAEDALVVYHRAMALEQQRAASGEMSGAELDRVSGGDGRGVSIKKQTLRSGPGSNPGAPAPISNPILPGPNVTKPMPTISIPAIKSY